MTLAIWRDGYAGMIPGLLVKERRFQRVARQEKVR